VKKPRFERGFFLGAPGRAQSLAMNGGSDARKTGRSEIPSDPFAPATQLRRCSGLANLITHSLSNFTQSLSKMR